MALSNDTLLKILKPRGHAKPSLKAGRHSFVWAPVHIWNCRCKFFGDRLAFLAASTDRTLESRSRFNFWQVLGRHTLRSLREMENENQLAGQRVGREGRERGKWLLEGTIWLSFHVHRRLSLVLRRGWQGVHEGKSSDIMAAIAVVQAPGNLTRNLNFSGGGGGEGATEAWVPENSWVLPSL